METGGCGLSPEGAGQTMVFRCLGGTGAEGIPARPPSPLTCSRRLFTVYPSTKIYFKHLGACPDEVHLLSHGQRMLEAVGVAVQHMDNLRAALSPLADLHAHVLRVDPANFPVRKPGSQEGSRAQLGVGGVGFPGETGGGNHPFIRPFSRSC